VLPCLLQKEYAGSASCSLTCLCSCSYSCSRSCTPPLSCMLLFLLLLLPSFLCLLQEEKQGVAHAHSHACAPALAPAPLLPAACSYSYSCYCSSLLPASELPRWLKSNPTRGLAGPAANRVQNASEWNIRPGLKYEWQASKECGHWQAFDPAYFCVVMEKLGGPLLMVGDSLSKSMLDSLLNQLQIKQRNPSDALMTPRICKHWERTQQVERLRGGVPRHRALQFPSSACATTASRCWSATRTRPCCAGGKGGATQRYDSDSVPSEEGRSFAEL